MNVENRSYTKGIVCLAVLLLFLVQFVPLCSAVAFDEATEVMEQAEYDLGSAFVAVAEAEGAGADVSVLLGRLDGAGGFLLEAHAAFRVGDYESAVSFALACSSAVDGVVDDAARLRMDAEKAYSDRFVLTAVGSGAGLVLLLVLGFLGWRLLKRRYFRRVLDLKPEVEETR